MPDAEGGLCRPDKTLNFVTMLKILKSQMFAAGRSSGYASRNAISTARISVMTFPSSFSFSSSIFHFDYEDENDQNDLGLAVLHPRFNDLTNENPLENRNPHPDAGGQ